MDETLWTPPNNFHNSVNELAEGAAILLRHILLSSQACHWTDPRAIVISTFSGAVKNAERSYHGTSLQSIFSSGSISLTGSSWAWSSSSRWCSSTRPSHSAKSSEKSSASGLTYQVMWWSVLEAISLMYLLYEWTRLVFDKNVILIFLRIKHFRILVHLGL